MQESLHTEFKRQWKDDPLKWISAFANAEGSVLMVEYDDRGQAVGIDYAHKLLEDISNKVRDVLGIVIDVNLELPERIFTGAKIKIGAFGKSNADLPHQDEITDNLFTQVDTAIEVLKLKHLKALKSYKGLSPQERYPIQVSVYPDKLISWSLGQPC